MPKKPVYGIYALIQQDDEYSQFYQIRAGRLDESIQPKPEIIATNPMTSQQTARLLKENKIKNHQPIGKIEIGQL